MTVLADISDAIPLIALFLLVGGLGILIIGAIVWACWGKR